MIFGCKVQMAPWDKAKISGFQGQGHATSGPRPPKFVLEDHVPGRWCDEQCMMVNRCMEDLCKEELTITLCTNNAVILANEKEYQLVKDKWQEST